VSNSSLVKHFLSSVYLRNLNQINKTRRPSSPQSRPLNWPRWWFYQTPPLVCNCMILHALSLRVITTMLTLCLNICTLRVSYYTKSNLFVVRNFLHLGKTPFMPKITRLLARAEFHRHLSTVEKQRASNNMIVFTLMTSFSTRSFSTVTYEITSSILTWVRSVVFSITSSNSNVFSVTTIIAKHHTRNQGLCPTL